MNRGVVLLMIVLATCYLGCAHLSPPQIDPDDRRLMVTLAPASPELIDRTVADLARIYDLRVVTRWYMASIDQHCVVFQMRPSQVLSKTLSSLAAHPRVRIAQLVQRFEVLGRSGKDSLESGGSTDPYLHLQHAAATLNLTGAHRMATGRGVRLAIIDTGIDLDHPEIRQQVAMAHDFTQQASSFTSDIHGTAVAGVIVAASSNGVGIMGVAPEAQILALKACWPQRENSRQAVCDSYSLALALDFAIEQEPDLLNLSLAGPHDEILGLLVHGALKRGIVVVAAATRASTGEWAFPASVDGVLGIRSIPPEGTHHLPTQGLLAAPGLEILSTAPGGSFDFFSGSSLAAANASGVVALVLEHRPDLTPNELAKLLRETARNNPGHDVIDACAAVATALGRSESCG